MNALTFPGYVDNVLRPIFCADPDDVDEDRLCDWLNHQLDEWELEAERPEGEPIAPLVIGALERILDAIESEPTLRAA